MRYVAFDNPVVNTILGGMHEEELKGFPGDDER